MEEKGPSRAIHAGCLLQTKNQPSISASPLYLFFPLSFFLHYTMPAETKPAETPISLKQTLEKSKLLTAKLRQNDLPPIERGLDQIDSQTHNLISKAAQGEDQSNVDVRA